MKRLAIFALCLVASFASATDRIDIVIDNSTEMWQPMTDGTPRFVAVRETLLDFASASFFGPSDQEIHLFIMGGEGNAQDIEGCAEGVTPVPGTMSEPATWKSSLSDLHPRGRRPLAQAIVSATTRETSSDVDRRRIILISSGGDQCHRDVVRAASVFSRSDAPIELRIIGLGLDRKTEDAAALLAPTRNVRDPSRLANALRWAFGTFSAESPRTTEFTFDLGPGSAEFEGFNAVLTSSFSDEETATEIADGLIRTRLAPGRYRAKIPGTGQGVVEIAGLVTTTASSSLDLAHVPPVTIEVVNGEPKDGEPIFVQFWGAPSGVNWVTMAPEGAPLGHYLVRAKAEGADAEVELEPAGSAQELETRFVHEPVPGVFQLLGKTSFRRNRSAVVFTAPESVETGSRFELAWTGPSRPEDRISIRVDEDDNAYHGPCVSAGSGGPLTLVAPDVAGDYVIQYHSTAGATLKSAKLEVFEVLATLDAPTEAVPGREVSIAWTGPETPMDFLCIAKPEAPGSEYLTWSPATTGSPLQLISPTMEGSFEIRYVRGVNNRVLARQPFQVVSVPVTIRVPEVVGVGKRFTVELEGTPASDDVIAISVMDANLKDHIDWSYTTPGVPLTLGAPFEAGEYEVRYISGKDLKITIRIPIRVK